VCPLLSCCLHCNFRLLLIPPLSPSHRERFLFISPLYNFSPRGFDPPSPAPLFPQQHHLFITTPQPSLGSLHSPLFSPHVSVSFPPLFTHFLPLVAPQPASASYPLRSHYAPSPFLTPYSAPSSELFLFSSSAVGFSFCLCLPPLSPPAPFPLFGSPPPHPSLLYLGHWC